MAALYVSAAGNDTTGDGSVGNPYRQITKAVSVAADGDFIYVNRGDSFNAFSVVSVDELTIEAYGSGALPIITGGSYGCDFNKTSGTLTLRNLRFTANSAHGITQRAGTTDLFVYGCQMDANTQNGFYGSLNGVDTDVSFSYFEDCIAFGNGNDGFGIFDTHSMTCVRCTSYNHTAANSDGFTSHEKSRMILLYCVAYNNETNVDSLTDNTAGSTYLVGCYFYSPSSAAADNNVNINSATVTQTNETYIVGCLFYDSRTSPGGANTNLKCQGRSRVNVLNCTFWSSTTTTTNWAIYSNQSSGNGWVGWRNCRFACVADSDARFIYIGTGPTATVCPTLAYCSHNRYDTAGGTTKHQIGGTNKTETQWKDSAVLKDKDGLLGLDHTGSTWGADPGGGPFTTKESAKITAGSALRNAGTSTTISGLADTYRRDLFGTLLPQGGSYDIGCHEYFSAVTALWGGGTGFTFWGD